MISGKKETKKENGEERVEVPISYIYPLASRIEMLGDRSYTKLEVLKLIVNE